MITQGDREKIISLTNRYKEVDQYYEKAKKRMIQRHKKELQELKHKHTRDISAITRSA